MRAFAKREAEADVLFTKNQFIDTALEHGLSHPATEKAFDQLVRSVVAKDAIAARADQPLNKPEAEAHDDHD